MSICNRSINPDTEKSWFLALTLLRTTTSFLLTKEANHQPYRAIAEYYAQATPEMQRLMEHSELVIIDVDDAIALGYAKLNGTIRDMIGEDGGDAE